MVDLVERINVMMLKQETSYRTQDYLAPDFQSNLASLSEESSECHVPVSSALSSASTSTTSSSSINEMWREKICEWSFQVIDHFDFSREVVSVSIHYLDRFLATRSVNKKMFQLAAMTCLFLAIKLHEPGKLSMASMIELSRGYFMVEQMATMELSILRALAWQVHPPTAYCFAKHILFLLPYDSVTMDIRHSVIELARFLTELSVIDYFFVVHRPSTIALASLLNAMDEVPGFPQKARDDFVKEAERISALKGASEDVAECRHRLRRLYVQGGYARPTGSSTETRNETISPVCVSYGVNPYAEHGVVLPSREESKQPESNTASGAAGQPC